MAKTSLKVKAARVKPKFGCVRACACLHPVQLLWSSVHCLQSLDCAACAQASLAHRVN